MFILSVTVIFTETFFYSINSPFTFMSSSFSFRLFTVIPFSCSLPARAIFGAHVSGHKMICRITGTGSLAPGRTLTTLKPVIVSAQFTPFLLTVHLVHFCSLFLNTTFLFSLLISFALHIFIVSCSVRLVFARNSSLSFLHLCPSIILSIMGISLHPTEQKLQLDAKHLSAERNCSKDPSSL